MGCDIHTYAEFRQNGRWVSAGMPDNILNWRIYDTFGFLADVRNYAHSPVISQPRGIPGDLSAPVREDYDSWRYIPAHSASWLSLAELLAYDYDQIIWDRRITRGNNGAALAEEGEGRHLSLREFLGDGFFAALDELRNLGDPAEVRIVFWFDN